MVGLSHPLQQAVDYLSSCSQLLLLNLRSVDRQWITDLFSSCRPGYCGVYGEYNSGQHSAGLCMLSVLLCPDWGKIRGPLRSPCTHARCHGGSIPGLGSRHCLDQHLCTLWTNEYCRCQGDRGMDIHIWGRLLFRYNTTPGKLLATSGMTVATR